MFQQFLRWWVSIVTFLIPLVLIMLIWLAILVKLFKERLSKEKKELDSHQPPSSRLSSQKRRWQRSKMLMVFPTQTSNNKEDHPGDGNHHWHLPGLQHALLRPHHQWGQWRPHRVRHCFVSSQWQLFSGVSPCWCMPIALSTHSSTWASTDK